MDSELTAREVDAYLSSYSDGLVDLFVGLAVVWIGVAWLWIEPLAGLAGIFPAVLVPVVPLVRRRLVEPRAGYVRWSAPRRRWERDQLSRLLWLGVGAFALGSAGFAIVSDGMESAAAGLPAMLLAIPAFVLGIASGLRRLLAYGAVLVTGGALTILFERDPGADLLAAGIVVLVTGAVLWTRFTRTHPVRDA